MIMERELTYIEKLKEITKQGRINTLEKYKQEIYALIEKQAALGNNWITFDLPREGYEPTSDIKNMWQEFEDQGFYIRFDGRSRSSHTYFISW